MMTTMANRKWMTWMGFIAWMGLRFALGTAPALAMDTLAESPEPVDVVVRGLTQFERRTTLVPMMICEDGSPCARPTPYWVLVLYSQGSRYELKQPLAVGAQRAPSQVELAGVQLRKGSEVMLEGRVEKVSNDYSIVTEVKRLQLLRPVLMRNGLEMTEQDFFPTTNVESWECRSVQQERESVIVQIWYGSQPDGFRMRLQARALSSPGKIAKQAEALFNQVSLFKEPKAAYFTATSDRRNAWLRIKNDDRLFSIPAELRVVDETSEFPIADRNVAMNCRKLLYH